MSVGFHSLRLGTLDTYNGIFLFSETFTPIPRSVRLYDHLGFGLMFKRIHCVCLLFCYVETSVSNLVTPVLSSLRSSTVFDLLHSLFKKGSLRPPLHPTGCGTKTESFWLKPEDQRSQHCLTRNRPESGGTNTIKKGRRRPLFM